ncbi:MAG TPA: sialidase family protein, partial [Dermatophilaceae bacterium]|nr:sialidase family protein [Dermatophilaceae bacterium]
MLWTGRATARKSWVTAAAVSLTFAAPLAIGTERALAVSPQVTQPATGTLTFGPSAIEGAGFQNVIAVSPFLDANGKRPVIAGADTAGFHISLDQGANWRPRNAGLGPGPERHIAGIAFSQKVPGRVWAVAGVDSGMLLASQDFGQTWGIVSTAVDVAAGNTFDHPRPVGRVIVADESGGGTRLWVSTRRKGLMTTTNNGATWSAVTPPAFTDGTALRGVTFDPANPSVVWVATARSGLWRVDAATSSTPQPSRVVGGPDSVEEITLRNGKVYVAGDINGFWTYAISTKTWTKSAAPAATWGSIDTTVVAGKVVAYAGGVPTPGDKTTRGLWRSNDEGRTWAQVMSADRLHPEMVGSTKQWWLWDAVPGSMPT